VIHGLHRPDRCCVACHVYAVSVDPCHTINRHKNGPRIDPGTVRLARLVGHRHDMGRRVNARRKGPNATRKGT